MHYFCAKVHRFLSPLCLFLSPHEHLCLPAPDFPACRVDSLLALRQVEGEVDATVRKTARKAGKNHFCPYILWAQRVAIHRKDVTLQSIMSNRDEFIVPLREADRSDWIRDLVVDDAFFADSEQTEVLGGELQMQVRVHRNAGDTYSVRFRGSGRVHVPCDRCLHPVEVPVEVDETVQVGYDDNDSADVDLIVIPFSQVNFDVAWELMESILLNLPTQRVHRRSECDADMLDRFSAEEDSADDEA